MTTANMYCEISLLFNALFSDFFLKEKGLIEYRLIHGEKVRQMYFDSIDLAVRQRKVLSQLKQHNDYGFGIYFGVLPRNSRSGKEVAVASATCLWADIDAKKFTGGKEEAWEKLGEFPRSPSIVVDSGHGYHAYWCLAEPTNELHRAKGIMKGIAKALNSDSTFDLARVLRVPGTVNAKPNMNPVLCRILHDHFFPERKYVLRDFDSYRIEPEALLSHVTIDDISEVVPVYFYELLERDKAIREIWFGLRSMPNDNSRSGYDMALASRLTIHGFSDNEIASVLRHSRSGKGREATKQYLAYTIAKARKKYA